MYLTRVYFGHGAYGVGAAAKTYFDKDPKDLSAAEAAFLAGMIQAPTAYDPVQHYSRAYEREQYVLQGMAATAKLSSSEADKAATQDAKSDRRIQPTARQTPAPHFV